MLEPFTRVLWWSDKIEDHWGDKLRKAGNLFHRLEALSVEKEVRDVCTRHITPERLGQERVSLSKREMTFLPVERVGSFGGWSNYHPEPEEGNWNYYGVVGRNMDDCVEFWRASKRSDHDKIGELLGFPEKARGFFQEYFVEKQHPDPIWDIEREGNVVSLPYYNNIAMRYFGPRLISFFPHSFQSKKGIEFGQEFEEIAREEDSEALEFLKTFLKMPYIWDSYHGVVQVFTPLFQGIANTGYSSEKKKLIFLPEDWGMPEFGKIPRDLEEYIET